MPAKSGKQYRLMAMVAHDPGAAKRLGMSQTMAKEMVEKTPARKRSLYSKARSVLQGKK